MEKIARKLIVLAVFVSLCGGGQAQAEGPPASSATQLRKRTSALAHMHLEKAQLLLKLEKWKLAIDEANEVVKETPDNALAWKCLGEAQEKLTRYEEAKISFERYLSLLPAKGRDLADAHQKVREIEMKMAGLIEERKRAEILAKQIKRHGFSLGGTPIFSPELADGINSRVEANNVVGPYNFERGVADRPPVIWKPMYTFAADGAFHLWGMIHFGHRYVRGASPDGLHKLNVHEPYLRVEVPWIDSLAGIDSLEVIVPISVATTVAFASVPAENAQDGRYSGWGNRVAGGLGLRWKVSKMVSADFTASYNYQLFEGRMENRHGEALVASHPRMENGEHVKNKEGALEYDAPPLFATMDAIDLRLGLRFVVF